MKDILNNQLVRYTLVLIIGAGLGAIFYPTKSIKREIEQKYEQKVEKLLTEKRDLEKEYQTRLDVESQSHREYKDESQKKITSLREENFKLKHKVSEKRFKIIKPDGTIEEKWFKDSETDVVSSVITEIRSEFDRKVSSIEGKWKKVHERRVSKIKESYDKKLTEKDHIIASLSKKETIDINKKQFGVSLGMTTEKDYFSSITYDIYGPFFLDMHLGSDSQFDDKQVGLGIGLRF
jgi:hypothetical protein